MDIRTNQAGNTQNYNFKTFRSYGAKEFFGIEGAIGLLTWFEIMEYVIHIIQKLEEEFWNHAMIGADADKYPA
ncbi:hypothetical protein Tco_0389299 [Tanacetum coccineum]